MTLPLRTHILFAGLLWSALIFAAPPAAEAGTIIGAPTYVGLSNGLVGFWSFDGKDIAGLTAYDRSGLGNNGTLTGGPTKTTGKIGQALQFDGVSNYVQANNSASLTATSFTLATWAKFDINSGVTDRYIIERGTSGATTINYYLWYDADGDMGLCGSSPQLVFGFRSSADDAFIDHCYAQTPVISRWYHFAVTYNGAAIRLYIDGVLVVDETESTVPNTSGSQPVKIGSDRDAGNPFPGKIDDFRIYNRALTADEIKRLYKMGSTAKTGVANSSGSLSSGLVGWWTFDGNDTATNASGLATVIDRSGNGKKATSPAAANTPTLTNGKMGQGMKFDGQDDYIDAGNIAAIEGGSEMTVSVWARTATSSKLDGEERHVVDQSQCNGVTGIFDLNSDPGGGNGGRMGTAFYKNGGGMSATALVPTRIDDGNWHHVLSTYKNGRESLIYFDGTKITGGEVGNDTLYGTGQNLQIGGHCNENANTLHWKGDIDDVRLYNRSVTDEEAKRLYKMGQYAQAGRCFEQRHAHKRLLGLLVV